MSSSIPTFITSPPFRITSHPLLTPLHPPRPSHPFRTPRAISAPIAPPRPPKFPPLPPPIPPPSNNPVQNIHTVKAFLKLMATSAAKGQVVTIFYHAKYCRACKYMKPLYQKLAKNLGEKCQFVMVEQEEGYELCSRLGVRMLPLVQIYQGGRGKVDEFGWGPGDTGGLERRLRGYVKVEEVERSK